MDKETKIILIGQNMSKAEIIAACLEAQRELDTLGVPIIICRPGEVFKPTKGTMEDLIIKMANSMIPLVESQRETIDYEPTPSKLEHRKNANRQRNFHNREVKTKIKSLKR